MQGGFGQLEGVQLLAALHTPDHGGVVVAGGDHLPAVGAEEHFVHDVLVPLQFVEQGAVGD